MLVYLRAPILVGFFVVAASDLARMLDLKQEKNKKKPQTKPQNKTKNPSVNSLIS